MSEQRLTLSGHLLLLRRALRRAERRVLWRQVRRRRLVGCRLLVLWRRGEATVCRRWRALRLLVGSKRLLARRTGSS